MRSAESGGSRETGTGAIRERFMCANVSFALSAMMPHRRSGMQRVLDASSRGNEQKVRCDARAKKIQRPNPCPSERGAQFRRSACALSLGQGFTRTESRSPLPVQIPTRPPEKKMRPASPSVTPPSSASAIASLFSASLAGWSSDDLRVTTKSNSRSLSNCHLDPDGTSPRQPMRTGRPRRRRRPAQSIKIQLRE